MILLDGGEDLRLYNHILDVIILTSLLLLRREDLDVFLLLTQLVACFFHIDLQRHFAFDDKVDFCHKLVSLKKKLVRRELSLLHKLAELVQK